MRVSQPWLVVIDMQAVFGDPSSEWVAEGYDEIVPVIERLASRHGSRVVYTRFVRDPQELGHWPAYYDRWSAMREPVESPIWDLTLGTPDGAPVVTLPTFSKWGPALEAVVGDAPLVLCGVATECCVLGTAFAAADAGREVVVVSDACAGADVPHHESALDLMNLLVPLITVKAERDLLNRPSAPTAPRQGLIGSDWVT